MKTLKYKNNKVQIKSNAIELTYNDFPSFYQLVIQLLIVLIE